MNLSILKKVKPGAMVVLLVGMATFIWVMERWDFSRFVDITLCLTYPQELLTTDLGADTPEGKIDFVLVYLSLVVVGYTLYRGLKYLIRPGEKGNDHIKRKILKSE